MTSKIEIYSAEKACNVPIQETEKKEPSSKQIIAGNPVNFNSYYSTKESVSSAYVTLRSLLENHGNSEVGFHQQLLEIKSELESATENINMLGLHLEEIKLQNRQENEKKAEEISSLREKLEQFEHEKVKSDGERDVRIHKLELKSSEQSTDIAQMQQQLQLIGHKDMNVEATADEQREEDYTVTTENNDEAEQQMKERQQKRLSCHREDSLEKMHEFATTRPTNIPRFDSGISIRSYNSVTSLALQDESGSGEPSVQAKQEDQSERML